MRRRLLRWLVGIVLVATALILVLVGWLLITEWRPPTLLDTPVSVGRTPSDPQPQAGEQLSLLAWNLGYAGLGHRADFFMDGGRQVRPPNRESVARNLRALADWLGAHPADVVLLQEVDIDASRTFGVDQRVVLRQVLPAHFSAQALNFKVAWIPYPVFQPLGRVTSGLFSLSRFCPSQARRHQLPGSYAWPVRVFHLKRCLHEIRFPAPDGRDWAVLHLHLSAFDEQGQLRQQQMAYLRKLMMRLYAEGHHVIVGGDWNQAFPGVADRQFPSTAAIPDWFQRVPTNWAPPGWRWAYDPAVPSLRATNKPYVPGESFVTIVDGFLVGPDVEIRKVEASDLGFVHSDHHPVRLEVRLKHERTGEPIDTR